MHRTRFIAIPPVGSHEAYEDMADFITTVTNRHTREHLAVAIASKRPFRRFKDALDDYAQERERWFAYSAGLPYRTPSTGLAGFTRSGRCSIARRFIFGGHSITELVRPDPWVWYDLANHHLPNRV